MITFHIVTLFPEMFDSYMGESLLHRAQKNKKVRIRFYNPRDFTTDKHHTVDDTPYGGGPGMVLRAEPVVKAVEAVLSKLKTKNKKLKKKIVLLSPSGKEFTNTYAETLGKKYTDIILIAGRYEGVDARVKKILKAEEVSIGSYTLTGGELPAMVIIDAVARRIPDVLGNKCSLEEKRVASKEMYTRPEVLNHKGKAYKVPKVLLSGNHKNIEAWRAKKARKVKKQGSS